MMKKLLLLLCCSTAFIASDAKWLGGLYGYSFASLQSDGQVFTWGYDGYGQLGVGGSSNDVRSLPTQMLNVTSATDVTVGGSHVCIVDQGKAKCAGRGDLLGRSSSEAHSEALVDVEGLDSSDGKISQVFCGRAHCCLLAGDRSVWCWGDNKDGSLANSENPGFTEAWKAVGFGSSGNAIDMALGYTHTCVLTSNGEVGCAGNGEFDEGPEYEDDEGESEDWGQVFDKVEGLSDVVSISVAKNFKCVVMKDNGAYCWGYDDYGIFSDEKGWISLFIDGIDEPAHVLAVEGQVYIIMKENRTVVGFGTNDYDTLVFGGGSWQHDPITLYDGLAGVQEIRGGAMSTCLLLDTEEVHCIGADQYGQLGRGDVEHNESPKNLGLVIGLPSEPMESPTKKPTKEPTQFPTRYPSKRPTKTPTRFPTRYPTKKW